MKDTADTTNSALTIVNETKQIYKSNHFGSGKSVINEKPDDIKDNK